MTTVTTITSLEWLTEFFGAPETDAERQRLLALHTPESYAAVEAPFSRAERPASLPELWALVLRQPTEAMG